VSSYKNIEKLTIFN